MINIDFEVVQGISNEMKRENARIIRCRRHVVRLREQALGAAGLRIDLESRLGSLERQLRSVEDKTLQLHQVMEKSLKQYKEVEKLNNYNAKQFD